MKPNLIDRIYESAFAPELWPEVLGDLSALADARGGVLFTARAKSSRWTASEGVREHVETFVSENRLLDCTRGAKLFSMRHAGFLTEDDLYTPAELDADPNYRDFLRPRGLGWTAATAIALPTGDTGIFCLERDRERGPVEPAIIRRLNELRPHLARSAFLATRMQLERAHVAGETLALLGLPALVLDDAGKVLSANDLVASLRNHVIWLARERVSFLDPCAEARFSHVLANLADERAAGALTFAVRGGGEAPPMIANLVPIRGAARDIFVHCAAVLVVAPLSAPLPPPVALVQSLFDLTPAEARVASGLAAGKDVEEIAADGAVSRNTIRTHVRGVLEKTGCNRQAEVVALLSMVSPARAR